MPARTTNLFLLEDLEDFSRTKNPADSDLRAFYEGNKGGAIYNPSFQPFTPPVPFLLVRPAVINDWKFFLDNDDWLDVWARRFGQSAVQALAEELRRLPWRASPD